MLKKLDVQTHEAVTNVKFDEIIDNLPNLKSFTFTTDLPYTSNTEELDRYNEMMDKVHNEHPDCRISIGIFN